MSVRDWIPFARKAAPPVRVVSQVERELLGVYQYRDAPKRNAEDLVKAYASMPWLRAIFDKIARATATVPWTLEMPLRAPAGKAYRDRALQGGDLTTRKQLGAMLRKTQRLRPVETHPALDALEGGNPLLVGMNVRRVTQIHLDLVGEAFWLFERNGAGMVIAIWPLPPHAVHRTPTPAYPFYDIYYRGAVLRGVPASEILWFCEPDPWDPYGRGTGLGGALADELEGGEYAGKTIKSFFYNDARPPVLVMPAADAGPMEEHEAKRLGGGWTEKLAGFLNRYKPMFLSRRVEVRELQTKFDDMPLVELLRYYRDTQQQVSSMPPEMLGILENANRSTVEAAELFFARHLIVPRLELQRAHLQERFIPQYDERLVLSYISPVPEDHAFSLAVMTARPQAFAVNDYRVKAGFEELPGDEGKIFVVGFADRAVRSLDDLVDAAGAVAPPGSSGAEDPPPDIGPSISDVTSGKALALTTKAIRQDDLDAILAALDPRELDRVVVPVLTDVMHSFGEQAVREVSTGISFDLQSPRVLQYLRTEAGSRIKNLIDQTTQDQLRASLTEGVAAGESTSDLAARIGDVFAEADGPRAYTIARTEMTVASNRATLEGYEQAGIEDKQWVSALAEKTRATHREMHLQVRALNEDFESSSGAHTDAPGNFGVAEEDINCLCFITATKAEKSLGGTFGDAEHALRCKAYGAARIPYERALRKALQRGFGNQRAAVMGKLLALSQSAAA